MKNKILVAATARLQGWRDDVSVVGFDDIPEAEFLIPPMTTVRQDFSAVGHRAIEILQPAIVHPGAEAKVPERLIRPELVVRASTAAPRKRGR